MSAPRDITSMFIDLSAETIKKSVNGNLTQPQADKMRVCLHHFDNIEQHIADIEVVVPGESVKSDSPPR